jgi:hypothetical protein
MARKERKYHYIYKTTNIINNKFYIGMHSTDNIDDKYIGSGKRLWYSLRKYGKENFKLEILEFYPDRIALKKREEELVNEELLKDPMCMNLKCGGEGGFISKEQQKYRSSCAGKAYAKKLKTDIDFKNRLSQIRSNIMKKNLKNGIRPYINSSRFTNKKHTEVTKKIMSLKASKRIGENNSQYGTCWITNGILNKKIKKNDMIQYINSGWKLGRIV